MDDAQRQADELFDFALRCYPDMLIGQNLKDTPAVRATYLYGVFTATLKMTYEDEYVQMLLLNRLKDEIGMSPAELADAIMKAVADEE